MEDILNIDKENEETEDKLAGCDMYRLVVGNVKEGTTLDKIKKMICKKLDEEYLVISRIHENVPKYSTVDVLQNCKVGVVVYISAHTEFFEWISFSNLKGFIKEICARPEPKTPDMTYGFHEYSNHGRYELHFETDCRDDYDIIRSMIETIAEGYTGD